MTFLWWFHTKAGIDRGSKKEEEAKRRAAIQAAIDAGEVGGNMTNMSWCS